MNKTEIQEKTNYCLNCKIKPCSNKGCPLGNDIPTFIKLAKEEKIEEAYEVISTTSVLPGICGRICPHMKQCEGSCVRGIKGNPVDIGTIESYIFDKAMEQGLSLKKVYEKYENEENKEEKEVLKDKKVAIIGGGPAGLTCAAFLAKEGAQVTIYEKYNYLGGLLVHGIPDFRLDKKRVEETVKRILKLGIDVKYKKELGKNISLEKLEQENDAIFLGIGANKSAKMGVKGEKLDGVYGGNELLEYNMHPNYTGKTVAVIGGGNVAMDCSRTIKRLRSKRSIYYIQKSRRTDASRKKRNRRSKERRNKIFISK